MEEKDKKICTSKCFFFVFIWNLFLPASPQALKTIKATGPLPVKLNKISPIIEIGKYCRSMDKS